ncbi:uncharacterized protein LOC120903695 isoform X2 [Anopheles arabiensis]|uniref:uncharacterized protein LOC120903695 isoform X2 n=1 Tax=Anopheles arabiensis TaxID=7173 RepID=UPI001AACF655|nr:uncharacterized protein LOC120903695 isoform X2 [Anopheles arabiensis]
MATIKKLLNNVLLFWILSIGLSGSQMQDATIVLSQGTLIGLKVFPETSRIPIYAYLGIPYAKPPVNELRFAPPVPSPGWNRTLYARDFKPICPQIENSSYEDLGIENQFRSRETSEDCLYLNIWIPETSIRYGGFPVLVMITAKALIMEDMPILFGITSNEGGFLYSKWIELARQSIDSLKKYINETLLPNIIERYKFQGAGQDQIRETIHWRYFEQIPQTTAHHIHAIIKIMSETRHEIPFYKTLKALGTKKQSNRQLPVGTVEDDIANIQGESKAATQHNASYVYAYLFHHPNSMDMRGRINFFGGASHSSDLPFLMGPSLYREIGRRRLSLVEDKLCKKMRSLFTEFIKGGNPTPGRQFDSWTPYSVELKYIKLISAKPESFHRNDHSSLENTFEDNLQEIEENVIGITGLEEPSSSINNSKNPYNLNPNVQADQENARTSKNAIYLAGARDSEYFYYLQRMDSFWDQFLPKLSQIMNETNQEKLRNRRIDLTLEEEQDIFRETAAASKYKHAFFSMLTLVCMLLAVLCICVYILKKNTNTSLSSIL